MRTDGKALHLAVVGLGQAGGNLAAEYYSRGYPALALNTAKADLLALNPGIMYPSLPETSRLYVGLNGYDGAGSDPLYGRECVLEHADTIRSTITQTFAEADAIILCAGLGGGTGSAIGTLAEIIHEVAPPLVGLLTLPSHAESALAKINAVRAVKEVLGTPLSGWIFVDNERIHEACASLPVSAYYKEVNNRIVTPLDSLNNLNSQSTLTPVRTFDDEDFRTLLLSGGILNYAEISLDKLDADTIAQAFLTSLRDSSLMPGNFGTQDLSYVGLIIEASASILDNVSMSELETLTQILKSETQGSAIYPGIYLSENNSKATLRTLVSCTSVPQGILSLLDAAQTEGDWLRQKITRNAPSLELGDIANLDLLKTRTQSHRRPSPPTTSPTTDRRVSSPSTPAIRRPAVQSRPRPSLQGHQSSLPTELPPVSRRRYGGLAKASSSETSATASEAPRPSPSISD
ncbi:MAG: hypothetical protein KTR25_02610, partial [Myxococcales bacterium]|nr:hypothetical protein [Myxococcales bacterium]